LIDMQIYILIPLACQVALFAISQALLSDCSP